MRLVVIGVAFLLASCSGDDVADEVGGGDGERRSSVVTEAEAPDRSTTSTTRDDRPERQDLVIAEKGFSSYRPSFTDTDRTSYAVIVDNPNEGTWIASDVQLNITFRSADGQIVKSESESISAVLPGQRAAIAQDSVDFGGATAMEVQARVGSWEETEDDPGDFTVTQATTVPKEFGGLRTTAEVASTFENDFTDVFAVAVYRDQGGTILGGAFTFVDFIPAGGSIGVEVSSFGDIAGVATTDVILSLSNLSFAKLEPGD